MECEVVVSFPLHILLIETSRSSPGFMSWFAQCSEKWGQLEHEDTQSKGREDTANFPHFVTLNKHSNKKQKNNKIFEQTQMENFAMLMGWEGLFSHKASFPVFYYILKLLVREYIIFHKTVKEAWSHSHCWSLFPQFFLEQIYF